jgi:outer membrane receptor for ferrienterochelin and colicins
MLALCTVSGWASAEECAVPEPVEVIMPGTRTPESGQRATVRTDVVTRDEAERRGATNVAEALSGQLGVQVNPGAYGTLGNVSAIQIQGFDLDHVLVLQNGERIIGNVGGAIDLAELPLTGVSRVEVVAGSVSSLYGASAIGGVVNILSAPPM